MRLEARKISFAYPGREPVLQDVSANLEQGQILFLLGHNGSGKTTLLSCLGGVLAPTSGQVLLDEVDIRQLTPRKRARRIGLIPQMHVPVFAYTVRQMVLMGRMPYLSLFGKPKQVDFAVADAALGQVGMADFSERIYTELSGGERQLVMIARGLAQQCDFLLMDEPDAHLDPSNQHQVMDVVAHLARERQLSFVIASHVPNSALMYADQVVLLHKGRILAQGGVEETLTEPLLSRAYGMDTEVIYKSRNGHRAPRAIVPRRKSIPEDVEVIALKPESLGDPDSQLEAIFRAGVKTPQVLLITGESGSGKSSWCQDLLMQAQRRGMRIGGVLSPAVVENGHKTGIDLLDLAGGRRKRLAKLRNGSTTDVMTDHWTFDMAVLQWGNTILDQTLHDCDLLIVDELGPLEFRHNKGLTGGFSAVDSRQYKVACVVVRPALMQAALERWPDAYVLDVEDA